MTHINEDITGATWITKTLNLDSIVYHPSNHINFAFEEQESYINCDILCTKCEQPTPFVCEKCRNEVDITLRCMICNEKKNKRDMKVWKRKELPNEFVACDECLFSKLFDMIIEEKATKSFTELCLQTRDQQ